MESDLDAVRRDSSSVWLGAFMLVQPVAYLLSATAFVGGCIFILLIGLGNALLLALAFVIGALAWLLPGVILYVLMGLIRNGLRVQARWDWLTFPLYGAAFGITALSGAARIAEVFN